MIPFENTWPYDIQMNDVYVQHCPFCGDNNVLLPLRPGELQHIREGKKKHLVFPCCYNKLVVIDVDRDYLLTDRPLRR